MMVRFIQTPLVSAKLHLITNPVLIVHVSLRLATAVQRESVVSNSIATYTRIGASR